MRTWFVITGGLLLATALLLVAEEQAHDETKGKLEALQDRLTIAEDTLSLVFQAQWDPEKLHIEEVSVTAYASTPQQTDSTPWETANGDHVGPAGAAVSRDLAGLMDQRVLLVDVGVVTVNDLMNRRHARALDLWVGSTKAARAFGAKTTTAIWMEE